MSARGTTEISANNYGNLGTIYRDIGRLLRTALVNYQKERSRRRQVHKPSLCSHLVGQPGHE
ncbi:MAG: hypothetical protein MZV63_10925 [Marinilabiliales bacterium]|nr:hypothetical protein [Marinilabiliales bacterium]